MKGIVTKYLNERVEDPSLDAQNLVYYKPGDEIDIVEIVNGQEYDGNKVWYKLKNGTYVWSGGVKGVRNVELPTTSNDASDIFKNYAGDGSGVGIAVLDTGINNTHTHLQGRVTQYRSELMGGSLANIHDHGHKVCGIVASSDPNVNRNRSNLYCYRVSGSANEVHDYAVLSALQHISNSGWHANIDLVNMSIDIGDPTTYLPLLQTAVDNLILHGVTCVVAAGENLSKNHIADLKNVIKVATFNPANLQDLLQLGIPKIFDTCLMNVALPTYSMNGTTLDDTIARDSAYTAYTTAVLARYISQNAPAKNSDRVNLLKRYIQSLNNPLNATIETLKFYK